MTEADYCPLAGTIEEINPYPTWEGQKPIRYLKYPTLKPGWIVTRSGRKIWPFDPDPADILIEDIAYHLAGIYRFSGSSRITVAQHSYYVSTCVPMAWSLAGLLHDSAEAYLGDVASPVKELPEYQEYRLAESRMMAVIASKFKFVWPLPERVVQADRKVAASELQTMTAEQRAGYLDCPKMKATSPVPGLRIPTWTPEEAEQAFLRKFKFLTI